MDDLAGWRRVRVPLLLRPASSRSAVPAAVAPAAVPIAAAPAAGAVPASKKNGVLAAGDAGDVVETVSRDLVGRQTAAAASEASPRERACAAPGEGRGSAVASAEARGPVGAGAGDGARVVLVSAVEVHIRLFAAAALEASRPLLATPIRRGGGGERGHDEHGERREGEEALVGGHFEVGVFFGVEKNEEEEERKKKFVKRDELNNAEKGGKKSQCSKEPTAPPLSLPLPLHPKSLSLSPSRYRTPPFRPAMVAHASVRSSLVARPVVAARRTAVAAKAQPAKAPAAVSRFLLFFSRLRKPSSVEREREICTSVPTSASLSLAPLCSQIQTVSRAKQLSLRGFAIPRRVTEQRGGHGIDRRRCCRRRRRCLSLLFLFCLPSSSLSSHLSFHFRPPRPPSPLPVPSPLWLSRPLPTPRSR